MREKDKADAHFLRKLIQSRSPGQHLHEFTRTRHAGLQIQIL